MAEAFQREYLIFEEIISWQDYYVVEISKLVGGDKIETEIVREPNNNNLEKIFGAVKKAGFGDPKEDIVATTIPVSRYGRVTVHPISSVNLNCFHEMLKEKD
jgi:hypothetical protein